MSQTLNTSPAPYDPVYPRGKFLSGAQLSRNLEAPGLPTFLYHWETFLSLLSSFFRVQFSPCCNKNSPVNKHTVCLSELPKRHSKSINSHIVTVYYYCYKILFFRQLFHLFQNENKHKKQLLCKERNILLISTDDYSTQGNIL